MRQRGWPVSHSIIRAPTPDAIAAAADLIRAGQVVGVPTETVYGLAANACDDKAVARVFALKNRPEFSPLITSVKDLETVKKYVVMNEYARALAHAFWPGGMTFILPQQPHNGISRLTTGIQTCMSIRLTSHPVAQALLRQCDCPLIITSANPSGTICTTTPQHVQSAFGDALPMILADGAATIGVESTIIDLSEADPVVMRQGAITVQQIEEVLGRSVLVGENPKAQPKRYRMPVPLRLGAVDVAGDEALLAFGSLKFMGVRGGGFARDLPSHRLRNLSESGDLEEAASRLFSAIHDLEKSGARQIAVMDIPAVGIGLAIRDRLTRIVESQQQEHT